MNLLEKIIAKIKWLRNQPENVKVRYITITALVIFVFVAVLWVGLFRKYEKKAPDDGKSTQLIIEEGKKIKEELNKIKMPDIKLPEVSPEVSVEASPAISPLVSPEVSPIISPEASPEMSSKNSIKNFP
ncbi:hypothetical protein KKB43_01800 [Patescibacteria group bacterium]|nr:hypothetical protein [Patescibacteria group bacterium]MBU4579728.1 hypothetical protein [Patescibacteria group bacterium]